MEDAGKRSRTPDLSSEEVPNLGTLFTKILEVTASEKEKHLAEGVWSGLSIKMENMPLNVTSKLFCFISNCEISRQWILDLRTDEWFVVYANDIASPEFMDEDGSGEYIQTIDFEKLEELSFYHQRFHLGNYKTQFQQGAEYVAECRINDDVSFEEELERFAELIRDFANKYKKRMESVSSTCKKRNAN